jgi:hypothetical protein
MIQIIINDIANKVRSAALTGLSLATGGAISDTDTVLQAFGKLQKQVTDANTLISQLDAAVVLKGTWDASAGTFPGAGVAQAGWSYIVATGGTVNGVVFTANDRIVAIVDNASTATYAANWHKLDYTDQVLSVNGNTGAVTGLEEAANKSTSVTTDQASDTKYPSVKSVYDWAVSTLFSPDQNYYHRIAGSGVNERWYTQSPNSHSNVTSTRGGNFIIYMPFVVVKTITIDRLGVEITSAGTAGSVLRLGVYSSTTDNMPNALLLDAGTVNANSATFQALSVSLQLQPGLYFFAYNHNSAVSPTFRVLNAGASPNVLGFSSAGGADMALMFGKAETYGVGYTLPNPATVPDSYFTAAPIAVYHRISA